MYNLGRTCEHTELSPHIARFTPVSSTASLGLHVGQAKEIREFSPPSTGLIIVINNEIKIKSFLPRWYSDAVKHHGKIRTKARKKEWRQKKEE